MIDMIAMHKQYSANNIIPYPLTITEGNGIYVYDLEGKKYLDMVSGISAVTLGTNTHALFQPCWRS